MDKHRTPVPPSTLSPGQAVGPHTEASRPQASDLLTTDEACRYLRLSQPTLERRRLAGEEPVFVRLGRRIYYRRADLEGWLARSRSQFVVKR